MMETVIQVQVSIQMSTLGKGERALSALLYTHKIAHKTNEISQRSNRKDRERDMVAARRGGNKK